MAIIAHLDMDAFFAAVEERDNPQWTGLPIVVGSDPKEGHGRGVVSTANYAARKYGIRSGMPISQAWRLAQAASQSLPAGRQGEPKTIFVQSFWRSYSSASKRIMQIIEDTLNSEEGVSIQQNGVDECYFDLSFTASFEAAEQLAQTIKQEIKNRERLTCSIGIGPNKLIAKIASDFQKPNGLTIVLPEQVENFLEPLPVRAIPGIGPKTEIIMKKRGIHFVRDLKKYTEEELENWMGEWGKSLYHKARGVGSTTFSPEEPPKSISEQQTFEEDTRDPLLLTETLHKIAKNLIKHLNEKYFHILKYGSKPTFRTVTVTCRFADFETHTFSHTLKKPTSSLATLKIESLRLLLPFLDHRKNPQGKLIRLIGLRIEKLQ